jgi:hypothetical protein
VTKLDGGSPIRKPKDWVARLKLSLGRVVEDDLMAALRVGVVLTEDDYHSVSDPAIRDDPTLHEHNFPARVWWADHEEERSVAGLMAALKEADEIDKAVTWAWLRSTHALQTIVYQYDMDGFATAITPPNTIQEAGAELASDDEFKAYFDGQYTSTNPDAARLERAIETVALVRDRVLAKATDFLDWNVTAAIQELAEVREEFSWKPWATDEPFVNRDRVRDEVVDVMHFLGNILVAIGVTDEELAEAYQAKQEKNRLRKESGSYSARKGGIAEGSDV